MPRSTKKGPYVAEFMVKKVEKCGKDNSVINTYKRSTTILPDYIGKTFNVHNGHKFISVYVTEDMVGHKLGEFALTRTFKGHTQNK